MSVRNIILILAAVLITAGTGLVARSWINSQRVQVAAPEAPAPKATYVLVAKKNLPSGTFLKENHISWQAWPDEKLHPKYMVKGKQDQKELIGSVVRRGITAGEPITVGRIIQPGERGFLAAVLRPGYRAMAIKVNATSGISGLVFPGDRVDIILTHKIKRASGTRRASETVLTNVRVLAIDHRINDQKNSPKVGKNATLEVTPKQAEMLAVVTELGRLSLVLRSLAKDEEELERLANSDEPLGEPDPARGTTHTWDTEASRLLAGPKKQGRDNKQTVVVQRGSQVRAVRVDRGGGGVGSAGIGGLVGNLLGGLLGGMDSLNFDFTAQPSGTGAGPNVRKPGEQTASGSSSDENKSEEQ